MSIKKRARRIDLDTEEHIYHLKVTLMGRVNVVISAAINWTGEDRVESCLPCLGQISRHLWCLGVQVASSPALPAERDCAISPGGHHANVSSPSCPGVPQTCLECGAWSPGEPSHQLIIQLISLLIKESWYLENVRNKGTTVYRRFPKPTVTSSHVLVVSKKRAKDIQLTIIFNGEKEQSSHWRSLNHLLGSPTWQLCATPSFNSHISLQLLQMTGVNLMCF